MSVLCCAVLSYVSHHSWAGILDVNQHPVELAEKLWGWEKWMAQWEHADVLVLDEISMVDCDLFEKVCL
jgi:hypothetical protein